MFLVGVWLEQAHDTVFLRWEKAGNIEKVELEFLFLFFFIYKNILVFNLFWLKIWMWLHGSWKVRLHFAQVCLFLSLIEKGLIIPSFHIGDRSTGGIYHRSCRVFIDSRPLALQQSLCIFFSMISIIGTL